MSNWNKKVSLQLGGKIAPSFNAASNIATTKLDTLGRKEQQLKQSKALIGKLQADQVAISKTNSSYQKQVAELKNLQRAYSQAGVSDEKLSSKISKKQQQLNKTNVKLQAQKKGLKELGSSLKKAGIDTANLTSEEKRLERALEKTQKQAKLKQRTFSTLGRGISKVKMAAFGAAAAFGAMGAGAFASVNGFSNHADNVAKTADKLGISTDALQKLRYAAERTGVSTQTLDMAMQRMSRRLSEAANGTGEAKGALQELGLSAVELNNAAPDKALELIADRLDKVTNQKDRMRLAMKFFDSEGVALVNTLKGGSKALQALGSDAEKTGYVLNEKSLRSAEKNRDAYLNMKTSIQGISFALGNSLLPAFTKFFDRVTTWISENKSQISSWSEKLTSSIATIASGINKTVQILGGWKPVLITISALIGFKFLNALTGATTAIGFLGKTVIWLGRLMLANPIIAAITGVATAALLIYKYWNPIKKYFKETWDGIKETFTPVTEFFSNIWGGVNHVVSSVFDHFAQKFKWLMSKFKWLSEKLSWITDKAKKAFSWFYGDDDKKTNQSILNEEKKPTKLEKPKLQGNVISFDQLQKYMAREKANQQTNNTKTNHVNITNQVTVQGSGDKFAIMQGVEQATQKALYDFDLGGV